MPGNQPLARILDCGLIAVVRAKGERHVVEAVAALADGGVAVAEVTMTTPGALDVLKRAKAELGERVVLGVGTVLDAETARAALLAGAEFVVAPTLDLDVVRLCKRHGRPAIPGAFTPTEILAAWQAGAAVVKVFPADVVGPAFVKAMRGPLPQVRLMPTGGVDLATARDYLAAGACCLGVGSQLVEPAAVEAGDFDRLRDLAGRYAAVVRDFRAESGGKRRD